MTAPEPTPAVGVFDLETTGIDPANDRIVTAYVGTLDADGNVLSGHEWMLAPDGWVISDGATAVHGITTAHAREHGRPAAEVIPEIVAALAAIGAPIVAHNASYDFTMLAHEAERHGVLADPVTLIEGLDIVDTFVLDKYLDTYRKGARTLTALARLYQVELSDDDAHGAAADAVAGGRIALRLLRAPVIARLDATSRRRNQTMWARQQRASLKQHKRTHGEPDFDLDLNWPLYRSALDLRPVAAVELF